MAGFGYLRSANRDRYSSPEDAGPIGTTVWQVQLPGNPAINTGIVCAPTTNYLPQGGPGSSPPGKVATVYFGSDDGYLNAVAINEYRSAQLEWRFPAEVEGVRSPVRSSPTLVKFSSGSDDWGICFGADNGRVYCIRDMGDEPALVWRSAPLGEEGSKVRAGPLFRGGKAKADPEPGQTASIVLVGAISI
ncbi:MAG: hypothetical protein HRF45_03330 [Fimbriimonadia bacterium]|jgi:outer membrane protein assembly factor BamB